MERTEPPIPSQDGAPARDETTIPDLPCIGDVPASLVGRFLQIGPNPIGTGPDGQDGDDAMVHAVTLHPGGAASYRNRWVTTDATARRLGVEPVPGPPAVGPDVVATNVVRIGASTFALGEGSLAYELAPSLDTVRRVDLAGRGRGLVPYPALDAETGELHLVAGGAGPTPQSHVVISPGAFTRTDRPIDDAPSAVVGLALTRTSAVYVGDGFAGVAARDGSRGPAWLTTGVARPRPIGAHDDGRTVVLHVLTPSLERWTLRRGAHAVERAVLDTSPQHFARGNERWRAERPRFVWTVGADGLHRHDLRTGARTTHRFAPERTAGDLAFVDDPARADREDGGWLLLVAHDRHASTTELLVVDAGDLTAPPIAAIGIPRPIPHGRHAAWTPFIP